jgi:hypothetical protein
MSNTLQLFINLLFAFYLHLKYSIPTRFWKQTDQIGKDEEQECGYLPHPEG